MICARIFMRNFVAEFRPRRRTPVVFQENLAYGRCRESDIRHEKAAGE
jgi:hypothetical protein